MKNELVEHFNQVTVSHDCSNSVKCRNDYEASNRCNCCRWRFVQFRNGAGAAAAVAAITDCEQK